LNLVGSASPVGGKLGTFEGTILCRPPRKAVIRIGYGGRRGIKKRERAVNNIIRWPKKTTTKGQVNNSSC